MVMTKSQGYIVVLPGTLLHGPWALWTIAQVQDDLDLWTSPGLSYCLCVNHGLWSIRGVSGVILDGPGIYINRPGIWYRSHPNKMFYIPLGSKFQGESESGDIVPIHSLYKAVTDTPVTWPYFRSIIYHPDQNFKGILNILL
jgi:hypothetical protein